MPTAYFLPARQVVFLQIAVVVDDNVPDDGKEGPGADEGEKEDEVNITPPDVEHCVEKVGEESPPPASRENQSWPAASVDVLFVSSCV